MLQIYTIFVESQDDAHTITVKSSECVSTLMERIHQQLSKKLLYTFNNLCVINYTHHLLEFHVPLH